MRLKVKKIVTALGNETLNNELRKYSKYDVLEEDFLYQEALSTFIQENDVDVIIVSGILQGDIHMVDFISSIKDARYSSRIILIVESISNEDKNILTSKGIFDILYDQEIGIEDVIEAIDRETPINIKAQIKKEAEKQKVNRPNLQNITDITTIVSKVQKQEIIGVFGTNGAGKSSISANLVRSFSRITKAKILLIDFDTLNGNLNEILDVEPVPQNVNIIIDEDKRNDHQSDGNAFA